MSKIIDKTVDKIVKRQLKSLNDFSAMFDNVKDINDFKVSVAAHLTANVLMRVSPDWETLCGNLEGFFKFVREIIELNTKPKRIVKG